MARTLRVELEPDEQRVLQKWRGMAPGLTGRRALVWIKKVVPRVRGLAPERTNTAKLSSSELVALTAWRRVTADVAGQSLPDSLVLRAIEDGETGGLTPIRHRTAFTPMFASPFNRSRKVLAQLENRCVGMLLGAMAGDIRGASDEQTASHRSAAAFFAAESVIRSHTALRRTGSTDVAAQLSAGKWHLERLIGSSDEVATTASSGWLAADPRLCDATDWHAGTPVDATSLLLAAAPLAFLADSVDSAGESVLVAAQVLSDSPEFRLAAVAFAALLRNRPFEPFWALAAVRARSELEQLPESQPAAELLEAAIRLASAPPAEPGGSAALLNEHFDEAGPVAALAVALFAVSSRESWEDAINLAAQWRHDGRSAAALCGALKGWSDGASGALPDGLAPGLQAVALQLGQDLAAEFGRLPIDDADWHRRYPTGYVPELTPMQPKLPTEASVTPDQDIFVDESAQNEPEIRRSGDTEGDMSQPQGVEPTALEQAIGRYAAEQGPVEDVYREFLIADLWALTGPEGTSSHPADFQMEGQEKAQIWVCTDRSAMPDLGGADFVSGTVRVNGYRLLPLLAERNVRIFTQGDQMDLMIIGSRAIEISVPEITDAMRSAAAQQPGSWFSVPDQMYRDAAREEVPEQAWVGAYWVDEDGALTGRYRLNSDYRPSPTTLGFPRPESMLESILHMWSAGYVSDRSMLLTVARSEVALLAHEDGVPGTVNLGGKTAFLAGSSPKYLPDSQAKVRADVAQLKSAFEDVDLVIDVGTRHQADIQGKALLRAFEAIAAEEAQPNQGGDGGEAPASVAPDPAQPQPPAPPLDPRERFIGSMLAGAMGDALGYAIEFHDIGMVRQNHGDAGLTAPVLRDGVAQISDDTQMMLFTLEGLIRAHVARRIQPVDNDPVPEVQHAYQRWFHTQNQPWPQAGGPYAQRIPQPDGWLITNPQLFAARAPGSTCMSALANFAQTHQHASPQHRINDSKGCGGVMRAAPVAVWSHDPAEVFYAAVGTAALTHSHPSGYLSAGVLAVIVHQLIRDVPLVEAVRIARDLLLRWRGHEEQLVLLDKAVGLAGQGPVAPEVIKDTLGQGWVGEEALAIGLYAALATDNLRDALLLAVNHSGDSDSTGIVCGNIAGALHGARAVPPEWLGSLELREVIETLAGDALVEFSPGPPTDQAWTRRYPAW